MTPVSFFRFTLILISAFALTFFGCKGGGGDNKSQGGKKVRYAKEFKVVDLDQGEAPEIKIAVRACAGLYNRELGGSIYVRMDIHDQAWLDQLAIVPSETLTSAEFLDRCMTKFKKCVRYSYIDQQKIVPSIVTIAAVKEAIPLDVGMTAQCDNNVFDATVELAEKNTPYLAAKYTYNNYIKHTNGLAMLNPGYEIWNPTDFTNPELNGDMVSDLIDYVFERKLFVTFLVNGCVDGNIEKELLSDIVNNGKWKMPLGVYGYNNSWGVAGFLFEAQTMCLDSRNMGAIPSETGNLSFFSTRRPPIRDTNELAHNPPEEVVYDPANTYVAFVVGDGDNTRFIMSSRKEWLQQRLNDCEQPVNSCEPLTWSISPHLPYLAPDVLEWYYESSRRTGKDYFILPPSGHFYAYPTSLNEKDQDKFVSETEKDAAILGTQSVVHWDWFDTWQDAETHFLPKYARTDGVIRGVFPVNVPYMFPMFTWWPADQFYEVLTGADGGKTVLFRSREWRGINDSDEFHPSPSNMANELANYPPGTVTWVYMTSDGGLTLENSFMALVKLLPPHVRIVSADTAAKLALSASGQ